MFINDISKGTFSYIGEDIQTFTVNDINISEEVTIAIKNITPGINSLKVDIDYLFWTTYSTLSTENVSDIKFTAYPNPVDDILNTVSKEKILSLEIYNLIGFIVLK